MSTTFGSSLSQEGKSESPAPKPRGPYRTGERRRAAIIEQATEVFGEHGYAAGSLRSIAQRVGASPASLIQHFGTKEGLLVAVLEKWEAETATLTGTDRQGLDFFENLAELMEFHIAHPGLLQLFLTLSIEAAEPSHPAHSFVMKRYGEIRALWEGKLREARNLKEVSLSDQQIAAEIRVLTAVADGLELQWLLDGETPLVELFQSYLEQAILRWKTAES